MKRLLVLTSGGDAPGMNATIRAVVRAAHYHELDVFGSERGFCGLIEKHIFPLTPDAVANCIQRGGTILKTGRCEAFKKREVRDEARAFLEAQQMDGLVVIGGDGSFRGAKCLVDEGGPAVIGVPCTIDNDINGTEYCIGFDTACNTALSAIDKIRDTALSLDRNFMIEVMGRATGFIAMHVGIAGGAEFILIPEYPMNIDDIVVRITEHKRKKLASIMVVAEADQPGHSFTLADAIEKRCGIHYKVCILGHTQRGGSPTVTDRNIASVMGAKAVMALLEGESKKMVSFSGGQYTLVDFPDVENSTRFFKNETLININQMLCG